MTRRPAAAMLVLVAALAACSGDPAKDGGAARSTAGARGGAARQPTCPALVRRDALPGWARTGFSGDGSGTPHVLGARGDIVAVLFDYPPRASAEGNKILWVSRLPLRPSEPLHIDAATERGGPSFKRDLPDGPGPSIVRFPAPGCWRLELRWAGNSDSLTLKVE